MKDIITYLSVFVVLITFIFGYMERRSGDRKQRTLDFLLKVIEGEGAIHEAHLELASWVRNSKVFENDDVSPEEDHVIIRLLDYYDLVADSATRGVIDKNMIILHLGGRMRATYTLLSNYITHRRERLARNGLYLPFEKFVKHYICTANV